MIVAGRFGPLRRMWRRPLTKAANSSAPPPRPPTGLGLACGSGAGVIGALCGVGGGLVLIPAFKAFSKLTMHQITATSMLALTMGSGVGAATYLNAGTANVPAAGAVLATSSTFAIVGAKLNHLLPAKALQMLLVFLLTGAIPVVMSKTAAFQEHIKSSASPQSDGDAKDDSSTESRMTNAEVLDTLRRSFDNGTVVADLIRYAESHRVLLGIGAVSGFTSGLLGIGGGLVMTSLMGTQFSQHESVATSLVVMFPTGVIASATHALAGNICWTTSLGAGIGNMLGMYYAAEHIAPYVDEDRMRYLFTAFLVGSLLKMLK